MGLRERGHSVICLDPADGVFSRDTEARLLASGVGSAPPSLEAIAAQWAMAPQTLRRHLREEGRGFQQIKDELRRDAAIACLAEPGLTLPEIAQRLGFSEASTFHRAFKKWTGVAPGEYRQTQLQAPASG